MEEEEPELAADPDQADEAERRAYAVASAREIARRHTPNRAWVRAGIPVVLAGLGLLVLTWSWRGGGIGRYGFHPTFLSLLVVFTGGLMIRRGLRS